MQLLRDNLTLWTSDMQVLILVCQSSSIAFFSFSYEQLIDEIYCAFRMTEQMKLKKQHRNRMISKDVLLLIRIELLLYIFLKGGVCCLYLWCWNFRHSCLLWIVDVLGRFSLSFHFQVFSKLPILLRTLKFLFLWNWNFKILFSTWCVLLELVYGFVRLTILRIVHFILWNRRSAVRGH